MWGPGLAQTWSPRPIPVTFSDMAWYDYRESCTSRAGEGVLNEESGGGDCEGPVSIRALPHQAAGLPRRHLTLSCLFDTCRCPPGLPVSPTRQVEYSGALHELSTPRDSTPFSRD